MAVAGRNVRIYRNGEIVAGTRSDSITFGGDPIDTTSKDDLGYASYLDVIPRLEVSMNLSGILKGPALLEQAAGQTTFTTDDYALVIEGLAGSDIQIAGKFNLSNFEIDAPYEEATTFSCSLRSSGPYTYAVLTAPTNIALPAATGGNAEGETLYSLDGRWGAFPRLARQWQKDAGGDGNFVNIPGAASEQLVIPAGAAGDQIRVQITGSNSAGSVTVESAPVTVA